MLLNTIDLRKNPINEKIYGVDSDEELQNLAKLIKDFGMVRPIIVTPIEGTGTYRVISGHRRVRALAIIGQKTVEAQVVTLTKDEEERLLVLENEAREKTMSMKMREAEYLYGAAVNNTHGGRAIEQVAVAVGSSVGTVHSGMKVIKEVDKMIEAGLQEEADEIIKTMDTMGVAAAVRQVNQVKTPVTREDEEWDFYAFIKRFSTEVYRMTAAENVKIKNVHHQELSQNQKVFFAGITRFLDFVDSYLPTQAKVCKACNGTGLAKTDNKPCPECYHGKVGKSVI